MDEREKREAEEEKLIKEAREEAARIVKEAEDTARQIYGSSLEYVDDMLSEVNLIVLRSKELMRLQMESMLEEFDAKIDLLSGHKEELLELLREHTEEGRQPIKKGQYEIKIADEWKERVEGMLEGANRPLEELLPQQPEEEEPEGEYSAADFNLDEEYFNWLEEQER
ncbi:hypothetical protein [Acetivibrio ethanolgignens]|uniref:Uncharacterized protein n=1 Tax=Acetivibrio ethanolgignens TaxID=290052 RepID=A0A0V8QFG2_9FIRM|nr:hypothetical protein [Acetivibrio ethanolgignens]KSV59339.1 hypothetical protein ASU35_09270 [Acetivibrio ethanolgignens]